MTIVSLADPSLGAARVGYAISRSVGGAVVRNRIRRRLRQIVSAEPALVDGLHLVIVHRSAATASFDALRRDVHGALDRPTTTVLAT